MSKVLNKLIYFLIAFTLLLTVGFSDLNSSAQDTGRVTIYVFKDKYDLKQFLVGKELKIWKITDSKYPDMLKEKSVTLKEKAEDEVRKVLSKDFNDETLESLDKKYESRLTSKSNSDGQIIVNNLEEGIYYVREVNVTDDYEVVPFVIIMPHENGWDYEIRSKAVKHDTPSTTTEKKIKLKKVDQYDNSLKGVGFRLIQRTASGDVEVPLNGNVYDENGKSDVLYTDENGEINVQGIPVGDYVFREVEPLSGYKVDNSDNTFSVSSEENYELKVVNEKTEKGRKVFVKTSNDKKPIFLEGAVFKVYVKKDGKYETVKKDGKDYEVTSGKNGEFTVEDLDFGTYYLWEVKAPKGYVQLSEGIEFVIDENTKVDEVTVVKNEKYEIIKKKKMPKTGDAKFFILIIGGFIIFTLGYFISREKKVK